jgi:hypothetical protein
MTPLAAWHNLDALYTLCIVPIACAIFKPNDAPITQSFNGIELGCVPIFPTSGQGSLKTDHFEGRLNRTQVAITGGFAITDWKSQGKTYVSAILDLKSGSRGGHQQWTSYNVQLGRVKTLDGVWLRDEVSLADFNHKPDPQLQAEMSRLQLLQERTLAIWGEKRNNQTLRALT